MRVVLIEDHDLTRAGMRMTLQQGPIEVVGEASNGEDGVQLVHDVNPDIAIVDVGLPGIDGIEVTRRLKEDQPDLKVVILTLRDSEQTVLAAFGAGADSYCMKDIEGNDLMSVLQTTYEGNAWIDPLVARTVLTQMRTQPSSTPTIAIQAAEPGFSQILENSPLTDREMEVLQLIVEGRSNQDIADRLYITVGTVKTHVRNILSKLCADDRTQAAVLALRAGLIH
ncbi:MAG: response regulator transcription factor [Anaerolineae bacterium]|nr:response regulator transcription factor [Gloeobacterales cyanobacterium ES-bin-313]